MDDILDMLVEDIERGASPYFCIKAEYLRSQHEALRHTQWLEDHLDQEEMAHWEKLLDADSSRDTLERKVIIRTALAVGIRLALPH